ncbi:MAG: prephenate dehydratase [Eubacterium sp.]|nr:prephenate dehydratase [Eubacterium sp.]
MRDLAEIREDIDRIDKEIVELYEKRMKDVEEVAEYKIEHGKAVFDKSREDAKITTLGALASSDFNRTGVEELFKQLMSMSRKLQYRLLTKRGVLGKLPFIAVDDIEKNDVRVVFQGVEGAYSEMAVMKYFGKDTSRFHVETFRDAMNAIADGLADYAVLPIENSSAGIVSQNYDMLSEFENYIVGEQTIRIEHCLLGLPEAEINDIRTVYSHPQGLMQCKRFLLEHRNWNQVEEENTAVSALLVKTEGDKTQAAIASKQAAALYGLKILQENIATESDNFTRFIIVSNQRIFKKDAKKISICFRLPHESGALYRLMSHFIYNGVNMNKIESRPMQGVSWEYEFFVDFDGNLEDEGVKNALRGIREEAINLKILGNY